MPTINIKKTALPLILKSARIDVTSKASHSASITVLSIKFPIFLVNAIKKEEDLHPSCKHPDNSAGLKKHNAHSRSEIYTDWHCTDSFGRPRNAALGSGYFLVSGARPGGMKHARNDVYKNWMHTDACGLTQSAASKKHAKIPEAAEGGDRKGEVGSSSGSGVEEADVIEGIKSAINGVKVGDEDMTSYREYSNKSSWVRSGVDINLSNHTKDFSTDRIERVSAKESMGNDNAYGYRKAIGVEKEWLDELNAMLEVGCQSQRTDAATCHCDHDALHKDPAEDLNGEKIKVKEEGNDVGFWGRCSYPWTRLF